jgi:Flp pilus assembly pilin Flp
MLSLISHLPRWRAALRAFRTNNNGVAAVEFALIAPVMIALFFAVFEIGRAYSIYRHLSNTTDMVGDLVTRETTSSAAPFKADMLNGIYGLVPAAMGSHPIDPNLKIQVIPLYATGANRNQIRVYAKPPARGTAPQSCGTFSVTPDEKALIQSVNVGFVMVKSTYTYRPLFISSLAVPWEYRQIFAPRRDFCIIFESGSCATPC